MVKKVMLEVLEAIPEPPEDIWERELWAPFSLSSPKVIKEENGFVFKKFQGRWGTHLLFNPLLFKEGLNVGVFYRLRLVYWGPAPVHLYLKYAKASKVSVNL